MNTYQATILLFKKYLKKEFKGPMWVVMGLMEPLLYVFLYLPLLKKINNGIMSEEEVVKKFVPGILTLVTMGGFFSGFGFIDEIRRGVVDKFLLSPIKKSSIIYSILLANFITGTIQVSLIIFFGILQGLKINFFSFFLINILMILTAAITISFSHIISIKVKDEGILAAITRTIYLPLMLMSGIMLPISLAPNWMQKFALINPFYHIVECGRRIFSENLQCCAFYRGFGIAFIFAIIFIFLATKTLRKEVS